MFSRCSAVWVLAGLLAVVSAAGQAGESPPPAEPLEHQVAASPSREAMVAGVLKRNPSLGAL